MSVIKESGIYKDQYGFLYYYMEDKPTIPASEDHIFYMREVNKNVIIYEEVIDLFNGGDISLKGKRIIVNNKNLEWHAL